MLQLDSPSPLMATMFSQAAAMHASAIRLDVAPALVFGGDPSQPPDFQGLDEVIALARQYNLQVVGDLITVPWWIASCQGPTDISDMDRCGTDDLAGYGSMIGQIVAHAGGAVRYWEVWNEPDTSQFFTGTPEQYAWMLRTAHDAIKAADPSATVLLGGMSSTAAMPWLTQVFATPGAEAGEAFDVANIHERGALDALAPDVVSWRQFLSSAGFTGALWVTELGYPSDPAFQYDPSFVSGPGAQAAYLEAAVPTLVDAGASEVFVTERDNLTGQFASEGVLGGNVDDAAALDPEVVPKPSFAAVQSLAVCYLTLARDCPGPPPAAAPSPAVMAPTRPAAVSTTAVTVSDPGSEPLQLGDATLVPAGSSGLSIQNDGCSGQILEPNQTCQIMLQFRPTAGGEVAARLQLPSDDGTVSVPVTATAPSASSLTVTREAGARLRPLLHDSRARVGVQLVTFQLANPLDAVVAIRAPRISGPQAGRFSITADRCAHLGLRPAGRCTLSVLFTPKRSGTARAVLTITGTGDPLRIRLSATAPAAARLRRGLPTRRS